MDVANITPPPPRFLLGVRIAHLFSFLSYIVFLCFVSLRPVSCVPSVASVFGLSIRDYSFGFL
jgi:hypothetical protein